MSTQEPSQSKEADASDPAPPAPTEATSSKPETDDELIPADVSPASASKAPAIGDDSDRAPRLSATEESETITLTTSESRPSKWFRKIIPFLAAALPVLGTAIGAVFGLLAIGPWWVFLGTLALSTFFYAVVEALVSRSIRRERRFLWISVGALVAIVLGYVLYLLQKPEPEPPSQPTGRIEEPRAGAKGPKDAPVFTGTVENMPANSVLWIFIFDDAIDQYMPLEAARLGGQGRWRLSGERLVTGNDPPGTKYEALLVLISRASDEHVIARSLYYDILVEVPPALVENNTLDRVPFVLGRP